jgi:hypothetical protein
MARRVTKEVREMKRLLCIPLIGFVFVGLTFCGAKGQNAGPQKRVAEGNAELESQTQSTGLAVSLKVLQERVKDCMVNGNCVEDLLQLCGIRRLVGYVIDSANRDIVLIGKIDSTSPPLRLEDFVIALRSAWWIYAPLRGNTYYYSPPYCDIRPSGKILSELKEVSRNISKCSSRDSVRQYFDQWHEICHQLQKVTVGGIPPQTRFGRIMVEADYYMKKLVDGSDTLSVEGLKSLVDMAMEVAQRDITRGGRISLQMNPLNRFEFYPGEKSFYQDEGIVCIKKCQVALLTEKQFLSKTGEITGAGQPDPLAESFARNFTTKYDQVANQKPIYAQLKGLFRFVALANAMKSRDVVSLAGISLDYLLKRYPVQRDFVDIALPGVSNVREFKHREETQDGYQEYYLWLPSCGGVRIDMRINSENFQRSNVRQLRELRKNVLEARPAVDALTWGFPAIWITD